MEKPPCSAAPASPAAPSTTFVQTDAATFKELVQRLTAGSLEQYPPPPSPSPSPSPSPARPTADTAAATSHNKLAGLKRLHEQKQQRQGCSRRTLTALRPRAISLPASPATLSPAMSPTVSPSTTFANLRIYEEAAGISSKVVVVDLNEEEEARAIKEKRFYLHPSPRQRTRKADPPELLPLFPLSSPSATKQLP